MRPLPPVQARRRNRARSSAHCRDRAASPDGSRPRAACRRNGPARATGSPPAHRPRRAARRRPCWPRCRNGRPEPDRPLREADVGGGRGGELGLGLLEQNFLGNAGPWIARGRCRRRRHHVGAGLHVGTRPRVCAGLLIGARFGIARRLLGGLLSGVALDVLGQSRRLADLAEIAGGLRGLRAGQQIGIVDRAGARAVEDPPAQAPRGSDAILAIASARGPKPNRCSASVASVWGSRDM